MIDIYNFNPCNFKPYQAVKQYRLSKGEQKKCKSCKYFNKHLARGTCEARKRRWASPNDIACDSHERRKKK